MPSEIDPHLHSICLAQLAPWRERTIRRDEASAEFWALNERKQSACLLQIRNGEVSLALKHLPRGNDDFVGASDQYSRHAPPYRYRERAILYREFVQSVVTKYGVDADCEFIMDMEDRPSVSPSVPIFAFQKFLENRNILMPDVDFLQWHFYEIGEFQDLIPYHEKRISAIFVGSTTGGMHTVESIRSRENQRIRSALYFRGSKDVEFRLASITQCVGSDAEQLLREMGFGRNRVSWQEQFGHRFLLSMDGNGATCSRVSVALKSRCVLLKYESHHKLFYFDHMIPWHHYIPINSDKDVEEIVRTERAAPGYFASIAENGRAFYDRTISRERCFDYTAALLRGYAEIFSSRQHVVSVAAEVHADGGADITAVNLRNRMVGHIQDHGDVEGGLGEWIGVQGKRLEGFSVAPSADLGPEDMSYQVIFPDGSRSDWCRCGEFSGTRGESRPLTGFLVRLSEMADARFECECCAGFGDGQVLRSSADQDLRTSSVFVYLEKIRILIFPKKANI